jgi:hypothetical protein
MIRTDARFDNESTPDRALVATNRTEDVTNRTNPLVPPRKRLVASPGRLAPSSQHREGASVSSGEGPGAPLQPFSREVEMKRIGVVLMLCLLAVPAFAGEDDDEALLAGAKKVEALLLKKFGDCSQEERQRVAFLLGSRQVKEAVIPLMRMLHEGSTEKCRMVAALSLCLLGDERGTYAVRRAASFDQSQTVRIHCAYYYNEYVKAGSFAFVQQPDIPSNVASLKR